MTFIGILIQVKSRFGRSLISVQSATAVPKVLSSRRICGDNHTIYLKVSSHVVAIGDHNSEQFSITCKVTPGFDLWATINPHMLPLDLMTWP